MNRPAVFALLALLACASWWGVVVLDRDPPDDPMLPGARSDYLLEDFRMVAMDETGRPSFQLVAPFLEKNPEDDSVAVRAPQLTLFQAGQVTWEIEAPQAWIDATGERIELPGDVQLLSARAPQTEVDTRDVTVLPRSHLATSQSRVQVTRENMYSTGVGFRADLSSQQFDILSQVEGYYDPPS